MNPTSTIAMLIPLGGIALILVSVWLTGGARRTQLDQPLVLRRLDEDLPDFAAATIDIDADAATAIAASTDGRSLALIFAAGDKVVVRPLGRHDIRQIAQEPQGDRMRLIIDTDDFTHGRFALLLSYAEAAQWRARPSVAASAA
jgi:hypothetical protein